MNDKYDNSKNIKKQEPMEEIVPPPSFIQKLIINISDLSGFIYLYIVPIILIYSLYHYRPPFKKGSILFIVLCGIFLLYLLYFFKVTYSHIYMKINYNK